MTKRRGLLASDVGCWDMGLPSFIDQPPFFLVKLFHLLLIYP